MHKTIIAIFSYLLMCAATVSCGDKIDATEYITYKSYYPVRVGQRITYRLDSTVLKSFGTGFETRTYAIKDSVEEQFTDAGNRLSYRIVRYRLAGTQWVPGNTFTATPLENSVEYVENNLRFITLVNPVVNAKNWQGNSYLNTSPFFGNSDFTNWTYAYNNVGKPFTVNNINLANTITVVSFDSTTNQPFYNKGIASYGKGYEVFAKDIGKVYQDLLHWEYQVSTTLYNCKRIRCANNVCDTTALDCNSVNCDSIKQIAGNTIACDTSINSYFYEGYGIKLTMIDHN